MFVWGGGKEIYLLDRVLMFSWLGQLLSFITFLHLNDVVDVVDLVFSKYI